MAKMHSRARGKSGSKKPLKKVKHSWLTYEPKEIDQLIVKLAKAGHHPSHIGMMLRDSYGIYDVQFLAKKKITQILAENKLLREIPEDLLHLIKKDIAIMKHVEVNKKDMSAKRGLILTEGKIHRLAKYYKREGRLPAEWTYDRSKAKVLVE
ncbi:MAG TPA: 30S ribosomal protein S15 [Candidatus Nanoarchaeia archaeon]|nr:30S ribosomal protein S15 [Candidatus Nanoarchaeia archaeon]